MDVNGTRFHLYKGRQDWRRCRLAGQPAAVTDWIAFSQVDHAPAWLHLAWSEATGLTLAPQLARFPRSQRDSALTPTSRRGAAADQYGNWYWLSHDAQRLFWLPSGTGRPALFWEQRPVTPPKPPGAFAPTTPAPFTPVTLGGLTVTSHHYLVVGNVTARGLLVFDLHRGGDPVQVTLPTVAAFEPFDMAAAPDGGIWVLDRTNHTYWAFDRTFQVRGSAPQSRPAADAHGFQPVAAKEQSPSDEADHPLASPPAGEVTGYDLRALTDPIAIEGGPGQSVFILDNRPGVSRVYQFEGATELLWLALEDQIEVVTLDGASEAHTLQVVAHDLAYVAAEERLYVVERDGNQALAFQLFLDDSPAGLRLATSYLPMQNFGGRALVRMGEALYYDLTGGNAVNDRVVRWVQLHAFDEQRYQRTGALLTPVLDGRTHDCVWHRIFVDGCLPPETTVEVWLRAHNDPELLPTIPFTRQPDLYLRNGGTEIANYTAFTPTQVSKEGVGAWEVLCQQVQGRYGQLRLVLQGNGRITPQVRAVRAYYPRFSYARAYLPTVYLEDATSADFVERFLANGEGFYTEIEGKLHAVYSLFDGRSAPPETLEWLAGWLGLIVDPIWATIQARRQEATDKGMATDKGNGQIADRRRLFVRFARRLYERRGTPDGIKFALQLLLEPCLEELLARLQRAAVKPDQALAAELTHYALPLPTPTTSAQGFEDLLYGYLLAPLRPSTVRLVERYQTRNGRAAAAGDPTGSSAGTGAPVTPALIAADAHRFAVLIPENLAPEEEAMVRRIVTLEKPAHTLFEVRRYWDYYRVGEARLGLDTILGEASRFTAMILGRDYLAAGFLAADHPFTAKERFIIGHR